MSRFFSPSTGGFYSEAVHGARQRAVAQTEREIVAGKRPRMEVNSDCRIPTDALPIDASRYQQLMEAQQRGKQIVVRGGKPMAIEPQPSPDQRLAARRRERDRLLAASDWTQLQDSPLGATEQRSWSEYRQALRDLDMTGGDWPPVPGVDV